MLNASIQLKYWIQQIQSLSYRDLHLEIDNEGQFRTELHSQNDVFGYPIMNFTFLQMFYLAIFN